MVRSWSSLELQKLYEMIMNRFSLVSFDSKFHFIKFVSYFTENIRYLADKVVDHVRGQLMVNA